MILLKHSWSRAIWQMRYQDPRYGVDVAQDDFKRIKKERDKIHPTHIPIISVCIQQINVLIW